MSYELVRGEAFADGVQRIAVEQIDIAEAVLRHPRANGGLDESIHEARKCFKRIRSIFRLARPLFGDRRYRRENDRFREMARMLAGPRESGVAVLTIDGLAQHYSELLRRRAFAELRAHFAESHRVALWHAIDRERAIHRCLRRLRKANKRFANLELRDASDLVWTTEVRRAYRSGVGWMQTATSGRSPDAYHEWRKQAKHLRYHLRVLRQSWAGQLNRAAGLLHDLTDILGFHHDLTDLRRQLEAKPATQSTPRRRAERELVHGLTFSRQSALEEEARQVAARVYGRKPKAVVDRLASCWESWQESP